MTTVKKSKKLTLDSLVKEADLYDVPKKINLSNGQHTEILTNFSNEKISEMLTSLGEFTKEYQERIGVMTDVAAQDYLNIHTLLFFTTLTNRLDFTFDEKLVFSKKLLKTNTAEEIYDSFDKADIEKVASRIIKQFETVQRLVKNNEDMRNKLIEQVEAMDIPNKDMILKTMLGVEANADVGESDGNVQES